MCYDTINIRIENQACLSKVSKLLFDDKESLILFPLKILILDLLVLFGIFMLLIDGHASMYGRSLSARGE